MNLDKILKDTNERINDVYEISSIIKTVLNAMNYCNDENTDASHITSVIEILNNKINNLEISMEDLADKIISLKYGIIRQNDTSCRT